MSTFAVSFEKNLWEHAQVEFQEQLLNKRIHDAAVRLKLLPEDEPLPRGIQLEKFQTATAINFCVEFPSTMPAAQRNVDCDQFLFGEENTA
jgi:hypothetical protein